MAVIIAYPLIAYARSRHGIGYSLNGLWRVVERSIVWHTVSRLLSQWGLGVSVLLVVLLFVWKGYGALKHSRYTRQ